ncbi:ARMT1-like domain-containing protein [Prosthecochloris sp. SCSIO W1102]|uniref:damage-control phosphatase ARMT1 family protein n=1 Tax=Prosthecochloris sp. SCSIO W1102 TaxID=2992243 RepID=UPI00223DE29E|nr:ARMT1-like domain-containing protein [Prosthecochloris sp. SCSIO W1102]UZJ39933.1 ARMT1-like domain-containing protein [Prosthecochloris sp. SCSIO W1102]
MKTFLDCIPCFMNQALKAGRFATEDEKTLKELLAVTGEMVREISFDMTPPEIGDRIYKEVRRLTGVDDPFLNVKKENIQEALALYPEAERIVENSPDRLMAAIRMAIAGNIIDHGVNRNFDIHAMVEQCMQQDFAICDFSAFSEKLERTSFVLYIGDNAGESVFDRLLIQALAKPVIYVVREVPVINDVTMDDALFSGIGGETEIISSGSTAPGTLLDRCNKRFLDLFHSADLIISKGQGNYEALSGKGENIFFMLRAKCPVIASHLGVEVDDIVLKNG